MNPEIKESEYSDLASKGVKLEPEAPLVNTKGDEKPFALPSTEETTQQLQQIWSRIYDFLAELPEYLTDFFGTYRRPLVTIGLIFGSVVSVKLTLALLSAVNDIPLLAPTFELVGFAYTAWFVYRYLWKSESRKELTDRFNSFKGDVLGKD